MKNWITKILSISSLALLILSSCKKGDTLVTLGNVTPGALTASASALVLNSANLTSTAMVITFNFTQPNFGYAAGITNTLQIDVPGDNWANPTTYSLATNVLTQSFNTADFNNLMLKLGIKGGVAGAVNVRISSSIGASVAPTYSNVVAMTVTPFNLKSWIYVVGAFDNWTNATPDSLFSATSNGIYVGIINFPAGPNNNQFLILPAKNYNNKYATSQPTTATTTTVTENANNNLAAPAAGGQYLITLNINAGTIAFTAVDYYSVIGDAAQGWSTDIAMKYVNDGNQNWTVTLPLVSTGAFKIRQDFAWTNSWGIPNSGSAGYGVANTLNDSSNSNITIAVSGNYLVTFNAPPSAFGAPPLATTTYSAVKQ